MSGREYDKARKAVDRMAERLKKSGAEKSSEDARRRAAKIARESEKTTKHRDK